MIEVDADVLALIQSGQVVVRDLLWLEPRDRETGSRIGVGLWSDLGQITAEVVSPVTGQVVSRTFKGASGHVKMGDVVRASGLTVQSVNIELGQLDPDAQQAVRGYDLSFAPVEVYRGWFDPVGLTLVAPARARFTGFVDKAPITTPPAGEVGAIRMTVKSFTQELTRTSADRRSDASQRKRNPNDAFFKDVGVVASWKVWWGQEAE